MVLSLLSLCAKEVVRDHSSSHSWLRWMPKDLYRALLEAAFSTCRPLAVGELVQRWPELTLRVGGRRKPGQTAPNRLCIQSMLLGVVRGLTDHSKGVRRRMEMERKRERTVLGSSEREAEEKEMDRGVVVHVRADLFVNGRSWERVHSALSTSGPLKLQCRYLRVEEISVPSISILLDLLPRRGLLGVDIRYSSLGVAGLAELLPLLSTFPALKSLRLHYCNLDFRRVHPSQSEALVELSQGLARLQELRHLSLTALRLPGQLRVLLSSLPQPLEILELPYLSLSPADFAYLSCSHHTSTLQQLDLSENRLDENTLPSIRRLLSQASGSLQHLSLSGCGLTDGLLGLLLPSLGGCRALKSLALALNPLSMAGLMDLVKMAVRMPSLRQLLYPNPLEDYQPGLPDLPSSAQLLDWPLDETSDINLTTLQSNCHLRNGWVFFLKKNLNSLFLVT
uniref:Leucine-rich repeat-containing protein 14B n=1 Tax=Haplochromis burtoni TaxID=8153 RepID=A0A3Q2X9T5_HAPBU